MRGLVFAVCLVCATGCVAGSLPDSPTPNLTVVLDFEQPHSKLSEAALHKELEKILSPTGVKLQLRSRMEMEGKSLPGELVYFGMKGSCTMQPSANRDSASVTKAVLARTYSSDGEILEIAEVECDRVRASLQRVLGIGNPNQHESQYGTALARVMAHEMYHMLMSAHDHGSEVLTKQALSARDLLAGKMELSEKTALAFRERLLNPGPLTTKNGL